MAHASPSRLIRLRALKSEDLPPHPIIGPTSSSSVDLFQFLRDVLDDGVKFAEEVVPETFKTGADKTAPPAAAKVRILARDMKRDELPHLDAKGETWFARLSIHEDKAAAGTATFDEFEFGLRQNHATNEMTYMPSIFDAHLVADWSDLMNVNGRSVGGGYTDVTMQIYEMAYQLPFPLANRAFAQLIITANSSSDSFVVVQIPVDLTDFPEAEVLYINGRNKRDGDSTLKKKKTVRGEYVSVERVKKTDMGDVSWLMAASSDAKGAIPLALQKWKLPDEITKDVGFFLKFCAEQRAK
ncbi:hypothetical protein IWX49DRAFT_371023 [Phyllosticta citricarpa]|uniref:DUF3074 domain-containing protein n=2 Tax=Phyllosticta TaxID=121621 RepID=A0ABR1MM24_9PEZI